MKISELNHIQITAEADHEKSVVEFYRDIMGFEEIEKPDNLRKNGGAWFKIGQNELHVSIEPGRLDNAESKRHVCYVTSDLESVKNELIANGAEIISDKQPVPDWIRFYLRDPAGNRVEIAQRVKPA